MSKYTCYWLEALPRVQHSLLVVDLGGECQASPGLGCRATKVLCTLDAKLDGLGHAEWVDVPTPEYFETVWPRVCSRCKRPFSAGAMHSSMQELLYKTADGSVMTLSAAPIGAMWSEVHPHVRPGSGSVGPDGLCLMVKTPGGNWCVDGPSWENGELKSEHGWTRTGTPPKITVNPSIHLLTTAPDGSDRKTLYHGWLRDGVLIDA